MAVTGIRTTLADLRRRVDRVWTLYKMANVREGGGREAEAIPDHWIGETGFKNYVTGKPLTRREIEDMVEDYYAEWGWDLHSGEPTTKVLEKLGLANICDL